MTGRMILRTWPILVLLLPALAVPQSAPPAVDPMSLITRAAHENLTIVADPYITAPRYKKEIFGKRSPYDTGIVAIDVYFKNDNDLPIRIDPRTMELVISQPGQQRQRLGALSPDDVADRTLLTGTSDVTAPRRFPTPLPSGGPKHTREWTEMSNSLRAVALGTDVLPPRATTHGFLFFDLNHDFGAIHSSHLYIPDLAFMSNNKALFFFDIDLAAAPAK
jgi:hypothetical protein